MPPSARHQGQVLWSMRGTPSRLAQGGPAEPRGVVEPPPPPVEPSGSRNVEAGSPKRPCPKRHNQHHQEQRPNTQQHQTSQCHKPHQVPVPSCRAVVSTPNVLLIPPSRERFRCLKSRDQEDVQSHVFCQCPVQWSTRKDAKDVQDAGEMVTITTHNVNVELPTEQQLHLTEEVKTNVELPTVQPVHLTWEVQHLVWEVPFHFNSNNKSSCRESSDLISVWRCFKSNSSCDSRGSPGLGGADSSSCGNCQPRNTVESSSRRSCSSSSGSCE